MSAKTSRSKSGKSASRPASDRKLKGLSDAEKSAMRERIKELNTDGVEGEKVVLAKISEMAEPDRAMAKRIHAIVMTSAPELTPRTWYGMPAYSKDDKVVCFFKGAQKFKARYATFGFSDKAKLDEGAMWPTDFAVKEMTPAVEARISALVKKAIG
jgi:uncharacterized protein YdhG (YjbR/CyaY superfamily)